MIATLLILLSIWWCCCIVMWCECDRPTGRRSDVSSSSNVSCQARISHQQLHWGHTTHQDIRQHGGRRQGQRSNDWYVKVKVKVNSMLTWAWCWQYYYCWLSAVTDYGKLLADHGKVLYCLKGSHADVSIVGDSNMVNDQILSRIQTTYTKP